MKWLVGLDLRESGRGAVHFASWLAHQGAPADVAAVHVLEQSYLLDVLRREHLVDVEAAAESRVEQVLREAGLPTAGVHVREGDVIEHVLAAMATERAVDALVLGRQAHAGDHKIVRLGRVARKLVRTLPVPVIVVPPELEAPADGPIVVATDLTDESAEAAAFARRLADTTGRSLVVAHVVPTYDDGGAFVPAATLQQFYHQLGLERERDVESWVAKHGLSTAPRVVATGDVVGRIIGVAQKERAALVVVGSRRLRAVERLFTASVGTDLCRHAPCAVAIAPPIPQSGA